MTHSPRTLTRDPSRRRGWSFVELLWAGAVFGVLLTIALSARSRADQRSKVARTRDEMRVLAGALEAYYVEHLEYPAMANGADGVNARFGSAGSGARKICTFHNANNRELRTLTTPVAYLTKYPADPFADSGGSTFGYRQWRYSWILISYGPDRDENTTAGDHRNQVCESAGTVGDNFEPTFDWVKHEQPSPEYLATLNSQGSGQALIYDPTNGATSQGDIVRIKD